MQGEFPGFLSTGIGGLFVLSAEATGRLLNSYVAGFGKGAWRVTMFPDSYPGSRLEMRSHSTGCERRLPFFLTGLQAHVQSRVVVIPSASVFHS